MSRVDHIVNRRQESLKKPVWVNFGTPNARQTTYSHRQGGSWWRRKKAEVVEMRKHGRTHDAKPPTPIVPRSIMSPPRREDYVSRQTYRAALRHHAKYVGKMERLQGQGAK